MRADAIGAAESVKTLLTDDRLRELLELAAIVESSEDAIISKSLDGTIRSWNTGAERLYGYSREEAHGQPISMLAPPDRADEIPMIIDRIRRGDRVEHFETLRRRKDGREVYVSLTVSPVRDADGTIFAASVIARDLTKRREAELVLQASERRLEVALQEARLNYMTAETARLEAEALAHRLDDVHAVVDVTHAHASLDDLLHGLLQHVHARLEADAASIMLVDEDKRFEQRVVVGQVGELTDAIFATVSQSLVHRVVERHAPIVLEDCAGLGGLATEGPGVRSLVGVPLLVQGALIGSLCIGQLQPRLFKNDDLQLLRLTADRAAVAIDNARLYEKSQAIAETLQRSLLPKRLPCTAAAAIAARYIPAVDGTEVGGDWYDAAELQGGRIALMIGDVVGHGIEAAATMGELRHSLRAFALEGHGPSSALSSLNKVSSVAECEMATLIFLVFDPATLSVRVSNAGHLPPLLLRPDGSATYVEGGRSLPLCVSVDASYEEVAVAIEPGATLVLYTDGLVERRGATIDDGLRELVEAATGATGDVEELISFIVAELVGEERRRDDIALIALRVLAGSTRN